MTQPPDAPHPTAAAPAITFEELTARVVRFDWREELEVQQVPAPRRIAPHALAMAAEVVVADQELGDGRLVLLHDPAGVDVWQGRWRMVSLCRAQADQEVVGDALVAEAAWSWLVEALHACGAAYAAVSGTVTTTTGRGFGQKADEAPTVEIEIRASWTPLLDEQHPVENHLQAWQQLLAMAAGLPAGAGIAALGARTDQHE